MSLPDTSSPHSHLVVQQTPGMGWRDRSGARIAWHPWPVAVTSRFTREVSVGAGATAIFLFAAAADLRGDSAGRGWVRLEAAAYCVEALEARRAGDDDVPLVEAAILEPRISWFRLMSHSCSSDSSCSASSSRVEWVGPWERGEGACPLGATV